MWDDSDWGILVRVIVIFLIITAFMVGGCLIYSANERRIINREFGTAYTTGDMFWAGETIRETLIGQKNRVEINKEVIIE